MFDMRRREFVALLGGAPPDIRSKKVGAPGCPDYPDYPWCSFDH